MSDTTMSDPNALGRESEDSGVLPSDAPRDQSAQEGRPEQVGDVVQAGADAQTDTGDTLGHPGPTDSAPARADSDARSDGGHQAPGAGSVREVSSASQLEEEGEVAADYIEELLDITDLDGDIDIDARDGRAYLSVNSSSESNLRILARPDTVNALQELTRLAVQAKTGSFSRLILDVGGSREARAKELGLLVDRAVERIEQGAAAADLPPMSSYERKLVHDIVAERGFVSQSEGEGAGRHTVITR